MLIGFIIIHRVKRRNIKLYFFAEGGIYMDTDVDNMDLDEQSKKAAEDLKKEADELENQGADETMEVPKNEYCFDHIHNDEEAIAFIEAYNKKNGIKGQVPKKHDTILNRLLVIYSEQRQASGNVDE